MTAKFAALTLAAVIGWAGTAHAAGNVEAGQAKSAACMACHGMDGNSVNPEWPSLAGQGAPYILRQIKGFKAGDRQNVLMTPMAMSIATDQDAEDLAAYFSAQTPHPTGETEPSKLALGQKIFRAGIAAKGVPACSGCHGPAGAGIAGAAFPRIGGQHGVYVTTQLKAYQSGARKTDPNAMMRTISAKLTDEEIDAVASYLQGLR